ncbi:MAG: hypothetical protein VYA67_26555 [Actinomycetota bacterium]|nr:hypothetical protein [Actinomycetota bacterium]
MSFFDSMPPPPPPGPVRAHRPAWMQPDAVIPESVPGELLVIRTEEVAVSIGGVCAYPNGFEFTAHVRMRGRGGNVLGGIDPFGRFGRRGEPTSGDVLRLGLLYADGRRGATTGGHGLSEDPERLVLLPGGGGGSDRRWDCRFWVYPLPPAGPVTFVAAWPECGVAETRAELDGAAIGAAAARAVILWPEEPETTPGGGGGWSSQTFSAYKVDEPGPDAAPDMST